MFIYQPQIRFYSDFVRNERGMDMLAGLVGEGGEGRLTEIESSVVSKCLRTLLNVKVSSNSKSHLCNGRFWIILLFYIKGF